MQKLNNDKQAKHFIDSGVLDDEDKKFIELWKQQGVSELEAVNKLIDEYKMKAYDVNGITIDKHTADVNDANIAASRV